LSQSAFRRKKKPSNFAELFHNSLKTNYLFITYIVTSKPKRISVAAGVVHMIQFLFSLAIHNDSLHMLHYALNFKNHPMRAA
jgi:hypothetical protein